MSSVTRILYADGEQCDLDTFKRFLGTAPDEYSITRIHTLADLRETVQHGNGNYDLIILGELDLPGCEGLDLVDALHASRPDLPIVILTSDKDRALAAIQRGVADCLSKTPQQLARLPHIIRGALERKHLELEKRQMEASGVPTLLLVDDNEDDLALLKRALSSENFQILTASSAMAGFEQLARHGADIVVSDYQMPGMSGVEFLSNVRKLDPDVVRVLATGGDEPTLTSAINHAGIHKFLSKNWDPGRLLAEVRAAFQQRRRPGMVATGLTPCACRLRFFDPCPKVSTRYTPAPTSPILTT